MQMFQFYLKDIHTWVLTAGNFVTVLNLFAESFTPNHTINRQ